MSVKAFLEGGPEDLPSRIVPVEPPGPEIKIAYRNGYEHFALTPRQAETAEGPLPVYQWFERTKIAE
ncbi:DUF5988 family protein [Nocardia concava]|uniref:DUF5988 family protein n=1 Tax=Nocardia concava TaxID=257281 RepID=UPI000592F70B|nr:DUF5988 family protein [Nocardia concava]